MNVWLQLAIGIVALYFVLRFIRGRLSSREPSGSVEGPLIGGPLDPLAGMRSPKRRGPKNRSGAIALAEPDEEEGDRSYLPRNL